jgi:hypothetical protein
VDLFHGNGTESWPLAYVVMAGVMGNSTGYRGDCTNVQELTRLLCWTMVNDHAADALSDTNFFPLTIVYFKRAVDLVGRIACASERALGTAYLIGQGTSLQAISDWVQAYSSNSFVLKVRHTHTHTHEFMSVTVSPVVAQQYYPTSSVTALVNLGQGLLHALHHWRLRALL